MRLEATSSATLAGLLSILAAAAFIAPPAAAQSAATLSWHASAEDHAHARVQRVGAIGITVSDTERAVDFYTRVLSFEVVGEVEIEGAAHERLQGVFGARMRVARLHLAGDTIELTEYLAPRGRPIAADMRSNDRAFQHIALIVRDMDEAYRHLRTHGVAHASTGPQRLPDWNPNAGGIEAFYFRDPDGHTLEVLRFPAGKGATRWQAKDRLFLGIDHTAIVTADTDAALAFYRDALGFAVAGESENWGPEQERLNNVYGARLRITALRAPGGGPALELLEYLAPRDGRPYPPDTRANDLWHWQTTLVAGDAEAAARVALRAHGAWVSPGAVSLADAALGFRRGALVRDPDGHALRIIQP